MPHNHKFNQYQENNHFQPPAQPQFSQLKPISSLLNTKNYQSSPSYSHSKEQSSEKNGIRALWRSVITQALMDAASNSHKKSEKANKIRAIRWLEGGDEEFNAVCHMADLDPNYVKIKAAEALARGCKWRNDGRVGISVFHEEKNLQILEKEMVIKQKNKEQKQELARIKRARMVPANDNNIGVFPQVMKKSAFF